MLARVSITVRRLNSETTWQESAREVRGKERPGHGSRHDQRDGDQRGRSGDEVLPKCGLPVSNVTSMCDILDLDIGPISLDLLGLHVDLSRIVLDVTAEAGAGKLLGNLLCTVANLLNDPTGLSRLLNQILDLL